MDVAADTLQKALRINLDRRWYGTVAEIGAGQEVARWTTSRGDDTCFFAFADTVVARSYQGGNECHGWMGVKFQAHPHDEPSQIVLHVRMLDDSAELQQEALGIVGVNLLHAAFFEHHEPDQVVLSLLDRLTTGRIEIDMLHFKGPPTCSGAPPSASGS